MQNGAERSKPIKIKGDTAPEIEKAIIAGWAYHMARRFSILN
ncbi:MAG: hypothetical protein A4E53_01189 [Pelotomaculum sp. PtaB.Bin104]|nr:MAG: hypothetical protein A4E53_01189 [Pelotomaculum sp. PtaB.Bin104]